MCDFFFFNYISRFLWECIVFRSTNAIGFCFNTTIAVIVVNFYVFRLVSYYNCWKLQRLKWVCWKQKTEIIYKQTKAPTKSIGFHFPTEYNARMPLCVQLLPLCSFAESERRNYINPKWKQFQNVREIRLAPLLYCCCCCCLCRWYCWWWFCTLRRLDVYVCTVHVAKIAANANCSIRWSFDVEVGVGVDHNVFILVSA